MARVVCSIPGAPESISGVPFVPCQGGMLSAEIGDDEAAHFVSIPGYRMWDEAGRAYDVEPRRRGRPPKAAITEEQP